MEICDLYDRNRNKLENKYIRGTGMSLKNNEYTLGVDVWIKNDRNQLLLTQRNKKKYFPLKWECTSGMVSTGEDSTTAALREVEEEIGIKLQKNEGILLTTIFYNNYLREDFNLILDVFFFQKNFDLTDTKLQEDEVIDIKWVEKSELITKFTNKEMVEPMSYVLELLDRMIC